MTTAIEFMVPTAQLFELPPALAGGDSEFKRKGFSQKTILLAKAFYVFLFSPLAEANGN